MNKTYRRIIFGIFIIAFFITAPIIILYSAGYRYNFKKNKIQSVGALFLNSSPKNVDIFLNNQKINKKMPAKILNLTPNLYTVSIKKDNYKEWNKNIEVFDNQTTFLQNIVLFKNELPQIFIKNKINIFKESPTHKNLLYSILNDGFEELWNINLSTTQEPKLLYRTSHTNNNSLDQNSILWSNSENKIIIFDKTDFRIIDLNNPEQFYLLKDITNKELKNIKWDNRNDNIIYGIENNSIYKISLTPLNTQKIYTFNNFINYNNDYLIKNSELYFIEKENPLIITKQNLTQEKIKLKKSKIIQDSPNNKEEYLLELDDINYLFTNHNESFFSLSNNNKNSTYIFNTQYKIPKYKHIKSKSISWNKAFNTFSYNTDFEIYKIKLDETSELKNETLITRYGNQITKSFWHEQGEQIIFANHNSIYAVETTGIETEKKIELLTNFDIKNITTNFLNEKLYIKGTNSQTKEEGIFILNLHETENFFDIINSNIKLF